MLSFFTSLLLASALLEVTESDIDNALENNIILCTGPSYERKETLKTNTERDMEFIPFKKIFLCTNDPENLDIQFQDQIPSTSLIPYTDKQLGCLNCVISVINEVAKDPKCNDEDIIIFKHESVFITDMNLVRKAIGKILAGHDMVIKYWIGHDHVTSNSLNDYYHTDSFYLKVSSARKYLANHPEVSNLTPDYQFCEEYFTKYWISALPNVYKIEYHHSSWYDNELGFHHTPRYPERLHWIWDKKNYDQLYK